MRFGLHKKRAGLAAAAVCLTLAAVGTPFSGRMETVYADTVGTVKDGPVKVRKEPVSGDAAASVSKGTKVEILEEVMGSDGIIWYKIPVYEGDVVSYGYIRSDFVQKGGEPEETPSGDGLTEETQEEPDDGAGPDGTADSVQPAVFSNAKASADDAYQTQLKKAGFPDSYCASLLELHKKYPEWEFIPVKTGLDWNTVIENESGPGKNLVQSSANDSRKATDSASYDWKTNAWYGYDGAGWVCASPEFIAYCMDPRNYLDETYIFQFETLEYAAYQNADGVKNILANTFMSGKYTDTDGKKRSYADTFVEVGKAQAVSPYHLASRCRQEQGTNGTSPLVTGNYEGYQGYYNYFNIGAYTTSTASAAQNGLIMAKNKGWDSIYKSISGGASVVADNYVKKGQNTIYFEKFNVVYKNSLYSHQYMTNVMAAVSEGSSMGKAYSKKNQGFVFQIPVYENMPKSAVTFKDAGNPNNWLSSVTIDGYKLTPGFDGSKTDYSLVVDKDVDSIKVSAKAVAKTSSVKGAKTYPLNDGNNEIKLTCVSQSGVSRTYKITVARQQKVQTGDPIPVADGASVTSAYPIGDYLTGIQPGTDAKTLLSGISAKGCTVKLLKADGSENTGKAGTGNVLAVYVNGKEVKKYEVVVYGDINGDGKISNVDVVLMQKQILRITEQPGCYLESANTSKDGGVTNKDLVILQKHILNISSISQ